MANPTNCVRMYGFPMAPQPKISPVAWASTILLRSSVPAWMTTPMAASTSGNS